MWWNALNCYTTNLHFYWSRCVIRGNQNSSIWAKRVRAILYIWQTKTCIQTGIYRHETAEQRLFPRCVVYLRLSCSSWALFKKLLKITNYPSLAVYRTIPKPLRMPVVLTLTETTHVTQSKSSFFHPSLFFSLSVFCLIWSMCLYVSASTSVSLFFMSVCLSNQKGNKYCMSIGFNRWETWSISIIKQ